MREGIGSGCGCGWIGAEREGEEEDDEAADGTGDNIGDDEEGRSSVDDEHNVVIDRIFLSFARL